VSLPLLSCAALSKWHGARKLFENLTLHLYPGGRVGLIGVNGSGKSTLLKIIAGIEKADEGEVRLPRPIRIGYVPQESDPPDLPVEEVVAAKSDLVQARIALGKVGFTDMTQSAYLLSGGWRKRLEIASALAIDPDLLLLDEPTNHLDLDGTLWLERFLQNPPAPFVLVTHDRALLERVAERIVELDSRYPDGLLSIEGNYSAFIEKREMVLESQEQQKRALSSKVRREVEWLRKSPPARSIKSQARVQKAHQLREELGEMKQRGQTGRSQIAFSASERKAKRLLVANNLCKSFGEKRLIDRLSFTLASGDRMAIAGKNGSGKTTLLRLLSGEIEPDSGTIKQAADLKIVTFDQHREQLHGDQSLREALSPTGDTLYYRGQPIHVNGWAARFLFPPERLQLPVRYLSGGERARVLIARLMLKEADLLLLDEPTNDLDIPTLEVLEESLRTFPGAVVLITHDRYLLDRVATSVLGLGLPVEEPLFASYGQWELAAKEQKERKEKKKAPQRPKSGGKRLSYHEQRELAQIEGRIEEAEKRLESAQAAVSSASDSAKLQKACVELEEAQMAVDELYARWEELESTKE